MGINMKLSEIWERADKELTQVNGHYGFAKEKEACALGAVNYYVSGGKHVSYSRLTEIQQEESERLRLLFYDKWHVDISFLNDKGGWTFKQFAEEAKKLGL